MGYKCTKADHAVFICMCNSTCSIIALYIDNITMVLKNLEIINQDKEALKKHYEMTDLGKIAWILGICVTCNHNAGWIALSQEKFSTETLERLSKGNVCPISTPARANEHLKKLTNPEINVRSYQSAVGTLMYPMLGTCPDLAYTVAALGRHVASPGADHQRMLDHTFQYLRATSNWQLIFQCGTPSRTVLHGFVNTDWASDVNDCKSTSGFVFMLGGVTISWSLKKQAAVALLSTEAEYLAGADAAKEAVWLRHLLRELRQDTNSLTALHIDNQSTIAIAQNPKFHNHMKHIDVCYHFLQCKVENEEIKLLYVPTED